MFQVLLRNEIPSQKINAAPRQERINKMIQDLNLLIEYFAFLAKKIEQHLYEDSNIANLKSNLSALIEIQQKLQLLKLDMEVELKTNSQKENNENYHQNIKLISEHLRSVEEVLNQKVSLNNSDTKLQDMDAILDKVPSLQVKIPLDPSPQRIRDSSVDLNSPRKLSHLLVSSRTEMMSQENQNSFSIHTETLQCSPNKTNQLVFVKQSKMLYVDNPVNQYA